MAKKTTAAATRSAAAKEKKVVNEGPRPDGTRETIESIVVAFILAFLFRTFEAEAFVIPTGSMATTLMGVHKDVECEKCGFPFRVSASDEESEDPRMRWTVTHGVCPNCRFRMGNLESQPTYGGDRIIVTKFNYDFREPQRWDVIVFRYPDGAATNYIKRLVGLPGETIRIYGGDIFVRGPDDDDFRIARKDKPKQLLAMLRTVHNNDFLARIGGVADKESPTILDRGWPPRWQAAPTDYAALVSGGEGEGWRPLDYLIQSASRGRTQLSRSEQLAIMEQNEQLWPRDYSIPGGFTPDEEYKSFTTDGSSEGETWIRYRHFVPNHHGPPGGRSDWENLLSGPIDYQPQPLLIEDFSAYNETGRAHSRPERVGDLGVKCQVTTESRQGEVILELVEGGNFFQCRIDLADGGATLFINGGFEAFDPADEEGDENDQQAPQAETSVRGPGSYHLLMTNVDDQLRLWVDGTPVEFNLPTTYDGRQLGTSDIASADYSPVGIGAVGANLTVDHIEVLRDIYYIDDWNLGSGNQVTLLKDYQNPQNDQFFVLGDNSARSKDARMWSQNYVQRELLIGKAIFIYWPHAWDDPIPFWPNWRRMGFIR